MEAALKKNIVLHMKDTGNKRDYTEKRAGILLKHYYEMSYPDRRNIGRAGMLTKIKFTIAQWLRELEKMVAQIKKWDDYRRAQHARRNAAELIAEETAEELDREREKEREKEIRQKEKQLKNLKAQRKLLKRNSAKKIQRAFRHTRKKSTPTRIPSAPSNESKQSSLQELDNVDIAIIERIKELYGYLMEKKIFKTYREKENEY